ncbi:hypothetical protein SUBVAR_05963 [Subdoligranulum variabile DSM 15176]|uniref:Uncharacterized protein n=1 Tax=Subdoligranulum variabile DSM 15176 TaxID=411471 RepID=D1PNP2_9FIRM|nr:hypothetical protein SUBVAR_05963 [Subdoligranulum variabile DSM 15176]
MWDTSPFIDEKAPALRGRSFFAVCSGADLLHRMGYGQIAQKKQEISRNLHLKILTVYV